MSGMTTTLARPRNLLVAALVVAVLAVGTIVLGRAASEGNDDAVPAAPSGASGTMLAPVGKIGAGGLSVAEAIDSPSPESLLVSGYLVQTGDGLRLCSTLAESSPEQCGGPSLAVDGNPGIEPGPDRTTVLGKVEDGRIAVVDLAAA